MQTQAKWLTELNRTSRAYKADVKAVQCGDSFRQLLVGRGTKTKSSIVAVTERIQLAVRRDNCTVLEAASHLNSADTYTRSCRGFITWPSRSIWQKFLDVYQTFPLTSSSNRCKQTARKIKYDNFWRLSLVWLICERPYTPSAEWGMEQCRRVDMQCT